jgi:hypothetical protein
LKKILPYLLFAMAGVTGTFQAAEDLSDAPDRPSDPTALTETLGSYEHALNVWKTPEDINAWIASNFSYDLQRSMRLSETQAVNHELPTIHTPAQFFTMKSGTCVDLARFAVETLRGISSQFDPKYLMIEFEPIRIGGNLLRRHWLASFQRDGQTYFFADSKRPGVIIGPYNETEAFIREYERYRGRKVVAFREMESYQKRRRIKK